MLLTEEIKKENNWYFGLGEFHAPKMVIKGQDCSLEIELSAKSVGHQIKALVKFAAKNSEGFRWWANTSSPSYKNDIAASTVFFTKDFNSFEELFDLCSQIIWEETPKPLDQWQQQNQNEIILTEGFKALCFPQPQRKKFLVIS